MRIYTGLDILLASKIDELKGKRIGLVVNHTSLTSNYKYSFDLLSSVDGVCLKYIFTPEHGLFGVEQDMEPVSSYPFTNKGIKHVNLYGSTVDTLKPDLIYLKDLDALVFDIQDIGSRYYTYIYTMSYCMEAARDTGITFYILDRPNPINGVTIEGPVVQDGFSSFVGRYPICVRHGMTAGELGLLFNHEFGIGCDLKIIELAGWKRQNFITEHDYIWIAPSPNMPTFNTALTYPGMCLIEGTNLSEGRGTTKPFFFIGAPYINPLRLTDYLNEQNLPGVIFRYNFFRPMFQKHANTVCNGIAIHITDKHAFKPFITGVAVVKACFELFNECFKWRTEEYEFVKDIPAFDLLCGSSSIRHLIENNAKIRDIEHSYFEDEQQFKKLRKKYLLYEE